MCGWGATRRKDGYLKRKVQKFNCTQRQKESAHRRGTQNHYLPPSLFSVRTKEKIQRTPVAQQRTAQQKGRFANHLTKLKRA